MIEFAKADTPIDFFLFCAYAIFFICVSFACFTIGIFIIRIKIFQLFAPLSFLHLPTDIKTHLEGSKGNLIQFLSYMAKRGIEGNESKYIKTLIFIDTQEVKLPYLVRLLKTSPEKNTVGVINRSTLMKRDVIALHLDSSVIAFLEEAQHITLTYHLFGAREPVSIPLSAVQYLGFAGFGLRIINPAGKPVLYGDEI